jgi:hypothetical protein
MVKNVLIGKSSGRCGFPCTKAARFVGLRFILRQPPWLTAGFERFRWFRNRQSNERDFKRRCG